MQNKVILHVMQAQGRPKPCRAFEGTLGRSKFTSSKHLFKPAIEQNKQTTQNHVSKEPFPSKIPLVKHVFSLFQQWGRVM